MNQHHSPVGRANREDGWVVVVAVAVMALLLMFGLATMAVVDTQGEQSRKDRVSESAFNLTEGLLYAQAQTLRSNWPTREPCGTPTNGCGYVQTCTSGTTASTATLQCPNVSGSLAGTAKIFNNQDIDGAPDLTGNWKVQVRDDIGANPNTYIKEEVDAAACGGQICTWDANDNDKLWVRVDTKVRGKDRALVALLQLENFGIPIAQDALVAGSVEFLNEGNKIIVDATGSRVVTRCAPSPSTTTTAALAVGGTSVTVTDPTGFVGGQQKVVIDTGSNYEVLQTRNSYVDGTNPVTFKNGATIAHAAGARFEVAPSADSDCQGWDPSKAQVTPQGSYINDSDYNSGLDAGEMVLLESAADSVWSGGTCPSSQSDWTGKVFIKDTPAAGCVLDPPGNVDLNSETSPGFVIVQSGKLVISNNARYFGVIYVANPTNSDDVLVEMNGNPTIYGGVIVEGDGKVRIGEASGEEASIVYDPDAFGAFSAVGAAALVQNTWRELAAGQ